MALTDSQKHQAAMYLGYSGKSLIAASTDYMSTLVNALTNLNAYVETQVVDLLTQIEAVDAKITAATARMLAVKVGDIELAENEQEKLVKARKRLIGYLSRLLGMPSVGGSGGMMIDVVV
jgi:hypothetical protein